MSSTNRNAPAPVTGTGGDAALHMTDMAARLGEMAEIMLPAAHGMPSAGQVNAVAGHLEDVLSWRPDLRPPLQRALAVLEPKSFTLERLAAYRHEDEQAYTAVTTVVAACYYLCEEVRRRIGYPGQVPKTYDPYAYTEWVAEGLLDPVAARGPIYRQVPQ